MKKTIFEPALKHFFPLFEGIITKSGSGFFSSNISWADFFFAEGILSLRNVEPECLQDHPILVEFQERIHSLPQLKDYIGQRAYFEF